MQDHITQLHQQQQQIIELTKKLDQLNRLTQAVTSMYNEFKDDVTSTADQDYNNRVHSDDSPIIILDKLRSSLRFLLHNKQEYENQMRAGLEQKFQQNQTQNKTVSDKLDIKIQENKKLKDQIIQQQLKLEEANLKLQQQEQFHIQQIQQIQKQNEQFKRESVKMQELEKELKQAVKERDTLIKNRDTRLGRLAELETKLQQKEIDNITAIHAAQTANVKQIRDLTAERDCYQKLLGNKEEQDVYIKELQRQIRSLKSNLNVKLLQETQQQLQAQISKYNRLHEEHQLVLQQLDDAQANLQHATMQQEQTLNELNALKTENSDLLKINKRQVNSPIQKQAPSSEEKKKINQLYSAQTYEQKLNDKDKEIEELANRVRRLLALQHKANLSQKAFQEEKQQLEKQISQQRDEIAMLRKLNIRSGGLPNIGDATNANKKKQLSANEELLRDLQNMRAFGLSAAASKQNNYDIKRQKVYELDDVPEVVRPQSMRERVRGNYSAQLGKSVGYGAGGMLGGISVRPQIGVK